MAVKDRQHPGRTEEERACKRHCADPTAVRLKRLVKESELNLAQYELAQAEKEQEHHSTSLVTAMEKLRGDITQTMENRPLVLTESFAHFAGYDVRGRINGLAQDYQRYLTSQAEKDEDFIEISKRRIERARLLNELKSQLQDFGNSADKNKEHGTGAKIQIRSTPTEIDTDGKASASSRDWLF